MLIGLHHYDQDINIFLLVNWVVSGEADQSALIKSPLQALSLILSFKCNRNYWLDVLILLASQLGNKGDVIRSAKLMPL